MLDDIIGGATPYKLISAGTTNSTVVKGAKTKLVSIVVSNINAAVRYLKLYDKATAPTVGTDTPKHVIPIPGATTGGVLTISLPIGLNFDLGLGFALTSGAADSDTGAVSANETVVNFGYF